MMKIPPLINVLFICVTLSFVTATMAYPDDVTGLLRKDWREFERAVQDKWSSFTKEDLKKVKLNIQSGAQLLESKYRFTKIEAQKEWEKFIDSFLEKKGEVDMKKERIKQHFKKKWDKFTDEDLEHVSKACDDAMRQTQDSAKGVGESIKEGTKNAWDKTKEVVSGISEGMKEEGHKLASYIKGEADHEPHEAKSAGHEVKAQVHKAAGKMKSSRDSVIATFQSRYNYSKEKAEKLWEDFVKEAKDLFH